MELNKIHHGDCLEVMKGFAPSLFDLIVTSPPYFNAKRYSNWESYESYLSWFGDVAFSLFRVLKEKRMCIINISPVITPRKGRSYESERHPLPYHIFGIMENCGFRLLEDIIWEKPEGAAINRGQRFYLDRNPLAYKPNVVTEYILVFIKPADFLLDKVIRSYPNTIKCESKIQDGYERSNLWKINPETKVNHPAAYPTELAERCVRYYSFTGDKVLDPFIGSGTTAVACINTGRNFVGIEKEEEYAEIAKKRVAEAEGSCGG